MASVRSDCLHPAGPTSRGSGDARSSMRGQAAFIIGSGFIPPVTCRAGRRGSCFGARPTVRTDMSPLHAATTLGSFGGTAGAAMAIRFGCACIASATRSPESHASRTRPSATAEPGARRACIYLNFGRVAEHGGPGLLDRADFLLEGTRSRPGEHCCGRIMRRSLARRQRTMGGL
jgi:hypothetical protein